jgi:hypothetical protein
MKKRKAVCSMTVQQHSFQIIACPMDLCSSHTHLVVSARGLPHEPLTLFYEDLQKRCTPRTRHLMMSPLLSFFSFLEEGMQRLRDVSLLRMQEESSSCMEALEVPSLPPATAWAAPPSELQSAIRFYLAVRWGCRTRQHGRYEEICLSPAMQGEQQLHLFLAVLQQFYQFCIERRYYWYERNPAEAFRHPLGSRLLHAITSICLSLRPRPALNQTLLGCRNVFSFPIELANERMTMSMTAPKGF